MTDATIHYGSTKNIIFRQSLDTTISMTVQV